MENKDFEHQSLLQFKQSMLQAQYDEYLGDQVVLKQILHDFMTSLLVHQPKDIFAFAKEYFSLLKQ